MVSTAAGVEHLTHAVGRAISRVDLGRPASEPVELTLQVAKLRDLAGDGGGLDVEELDDVCTGCFAVVSDADHVTDLGEGEAGCLCRCDEPESVERAVVVVAVAAGGAGRLREHAGVFIEAQRLGGDVRTVGQLTDEHDLTFQCDGTLTVAGMEIELLYVQDCPNVDLARERIFRAARRVGVTVELRERLIADEAAAASAGMHGSPTVLVAGTDVSGTDETGGSLSCRLYPGAAGYDGAPDTESIEGALAAARRGGTDAERR